MKEPKIFIGVYTHEVKSYCDKQFFEMLKRLGDTTTRIHIIDNSPNFDYYYKLNDNFYRFFYISHIEVSQEPKKTQFLRNVEKSVNKLRDMFLAADFDVFMVIESDVIPPNNVCERMLEYVQKLPKNWAALGAKYYKSWHKVHKIGFWEVHMCLSGCTMYNREVIKKIPFRWSTENLGAFPDAWWCHDAGEKGYKFYDCDIECKHLTDPKTGMRGWEKFHKI